MNHYKVLSKNGKLITTDVNLHPGDVLRIELEARNIKKSGFAEMLGIKPSHLSELLNSKRHVSAYLAINLEKLLNIDAEYWMRVQAYYDLSKERKKLELV